MKNILSVILAIILALVVFKLIGIIFAIGFFLLKIAIAAVIAIPFYLFIKNKFGRLKK
jgi:hypothetical protein